MCPRNDIRDAFHVRMCMHVAATKGKEKERAKERGRERRRKERQRGRGDNVAPRLYLGFVGDAFVTLTGSFLFFICPLPQSHARRRRAGNDLPTGDRRACPNSKEDSSEYHIPAIGRRLSGIDRARAI